MNQGSLFSNNNGQLSARVDPPHNGKATSIAAARAIKPHAPTQRGIVLAAIRAAVNGLTREEIGEQTGLNPDAVRPRVVELLRDREIVERGERHTAAGRAAAVLWANERSDDNGL